MHLDARYVGIVIAVWCVVLPGCERQHGTTRSTQQNGNAERIGDTNEVKTSEKAIGEQQALEIAESYYTKIIGSQEFNSRVYKTTDQGYWIHLESSPPTPGGHTDVLIGFDGHIYETIPGA